MHSAFRHDRYLLKRQVLALTGKVRVYGPSEQLLFYSEQKMFRLREDIRVYGDESKLEEILHIQARQIIDFSTAYDVIDQIEGRRVGTLRRRGLHSLARDEWQVLDENEQQIGVLMEDDLTRALLRRLFFGSFLPQNYDLLIAGQRAVDLRQRFNLFSYELDLDFNFEPARLLDRRIGVAAAILLAIIEGKQDN